MTKAIVILFAILQAGLLQAQTQSISVTPQPVYFKTGSGTFQLNNKTALVADKALFNEAKYLREQLREIYGWQISTAKNKSEAKGQIVLSLKNKPGSKEQYTLEISKERIEINAPSNAGIFYGVQTLIQLMPLQVKSLPVDLTTVEIVDSPRFSYRGMHLDVARHFFSPDYIKKHIDNLARHKFNTFHWHLTDDQGWRLEIKKLPKLISVGSCRDRTLIGRFGSTIYDSVKYCGYYSQSEAKEIIKYAAARHINVIPEIDVPGHTVALLASYPELGCNNQVVKVMDTWGSSDEVICPGKESTYEIMNKIFDEVIDLFPSEYIHVGGDETRKVRWASCPHCQKRMKDNKLKDLDELQAYFIERIAKHINKRGRKVVGWDEIMEGRLTKNATVMSWRGEKNAVTAATMGHNVIMATEGSVYLDFSQTRNEDSITIGQYLPVEKVYNWEPIPAGLDTDKRKHILGGQGNLWTEYIKNTRKLEYMLLPRMSALSEVLWLPAEKKNWKSFEERLPQIMKRYELMGLNYSIAYFDMQPSTAPPEKSDGVYWQIKTTGSNPIVIYDAAKKRGSNGRGEAKYLIDHEGMMEAVMTENAVGGKVLSTIRQYFHFNKATGKKITLASPPNQKYSNGGAFALVDGIITTRGMLEGSRFLGFLGNDLDATVDLGKTEKIDTIVLNVFEQNVSWIYHPSEVTFTILDENKKELASVTQKITEQDKGLRKVIGLFNHRGRYVRVYAKSYGKIPVGKPGAGTIAWIFADEIEVK
jgi:hexosaminidase